MTSYEPPRSILLAVTAGLLLIAGPAGCGGDSDGSPASTSPTTSTARPTDRLRTIAEWDEDDGVEPTPMDPGTYRIPASPWSVADFTVGFPEGWTAQYGHVYATRTDESDELSFYAVVVDEIFTDSCAPEDESTRAVGPAMADLYTALRQQAGGATVSRPVRTTLGGYPATRIDLEIPKHLKLSECRMGPHGLQIWYSEPADKYFVLLRDATASVYVVDVDGRRQVFLTQVGNAASAADRAELQAVLDSIRIEGSSPQPVGPSPTPTEKHTAPVNGQVIGAQTHFGVDAGHYDWRGYDPVTDTGLFATGSDADRDFDLEGLAVVGPSGPLATLSCAHDLRCSPEDDRLSYPAALGPGADEVTVASGAGTARVIGFDGTWRGTLDLTPTVTGGGEVRGLRWSADSSRLAVVTAQLPGQEDQDGTVTRAWLVDPDGGNAQLAYSVFLDGISRRKHAGPDFDGEGMIWTATGWGWSPDGQSLLLDVWTPGQVWEYGAEVVVLHVPPGGPTTAQTLYHSNRHFDWAGNVAWSPDGTRIAVRTRVPGSPMRHRVTEISAEDGSVIAQHPHINDYLIWPRSDD